MNTLIGPFEQLLTMRGMPDKGKLNDSQLEIIADAGVLVDTNGKIVQVGNFNQLYKNATVLVAELNRKTVAIPGLIDCHSHACFAGTRSRDYSLRVAGKSYQEILAQGGGIYETVEKTKAQTEKSLLESLSQRVQTFLSQGVTTLEIKSGYGLDFENETKMLRVIKQIAHQGTINLVSTCLAAHVPPKGVGAKTYLDQVAQEFLPYFKRENLCQRVDIFVEDHAFDCDLSLDYLLKAKRLGFELTVHADQFVTGGSHLAAQVGAASADHLEASREKEAELLAQSQVVAVVLPGASLGLGMKYAPARMLLDKGNCVAIASDFNPGSAPNGYLLAQAAFLGAAEKLTLAETLAGITYRAALALKITDVGKLNAGMWADIVCFEADDYRDILYWQGGLRPYAVWCKGKKAI